MERSDLITSMLPANNHSRFFAHYLKAEAYVPSDDPAFKGVLCDRCQILSIPTRIPTDWKEAVPGMVFLAELGTVQDLKSSHCPLCRFFSRFIPQDHDENGAQRSDNCYICAFPPLPFLNSWLPGARYTILSIVRPMANQLELNVINMAWQEAPWDEVDPRLFHSTLGETGYLTFMRLRREDSDTGFLSLDTEKSDLDFVKNCIKQCIDSHGTDCRHSQFRRATIEGLRVIDCKAKSIVLIHEQEDYAALSYVWGKASVTTSEDMYDLTMAPKVVRDSMDIALELGLKYIWVDRYCIEQHSKRDRHRQIRQMGHIYACAFLTIFAAAGEGPEHGLPGVQGTTRIQKPKLVLQDGLYLASTYRDPDSCISQSEWASRAWTYQEHLFSRRRVFFTEEQVVFECASGLRSVESVNTPIAAPFFRPHENLCISSSETVAKMMDRAISHISRYSKRKLTYQSDRINAVQGILRVFEQYKYPLYYLAGVPFYLDTQGRPSGSLMLGLAWRHINHAKRQTYFPSWSWAGWDGCVSEILLASHPFANMLEPIMFWIEDDKGHLLTFPKAASVAHFISGLPEHTRYLHINSWLIPCTRVVQIQRQAKTWQLHLGQSKLRIRNLFIDEEPERLCNIHTPVQIKDSLAAVVLQTPNDERVIPYPTSTYLIVKDMGSHWERVGCGDGVVKVDQESKDLEGPSLAEWETVYKERRTIRLG